MDNNVKIISIIAISLLMINLVLADAKINPKPLPVENICRVDVDSNEAIEETTYTIQVPVFENITTEKQVPDIDKFKSEMENLKPQLDTYANNVKSFSEQRKQVSLGKRLSLSISEPVFDIELPVMENKTIYISKQVQKKETKYRFTDSLSTNTGIPFIESYEKLMFEDKEMTKNKIKDGYNIDEDTGKFYKEVKC